MSTRRKTPHIICFFGRSSRRRWKRPPSVSGGAATVSSTRFFIHSTGFDTGLMIRMIGFEIDRAFGRRAFGADPASTTDSEPYAHLPLGGSLALAG